MMRKHTPKTILFIAILLVTSVACKNRLESIPFTDETNNPQPVTVPFKFTEVKKLDWPDKSVTLKLRSTKIDFDKIPDRPFDSLGFMPLSKQPEEIPFDWDKLPDSAFNYDDLRSKPLKFKVSILEPPQVIKADLHIRPGSRDLIYEFGEPLANKPNISLLQDRNGFIWIGTREGLYRYDGQNLLLYTQVRDASTLIDDNNGQIWASLRNNNGICVINRKSGLLKRLTKANGLATNNVGRMVAVDDKIWLLNIPNDNKDHDGVSIIDENDQTIKWFEHAGWSINSPKRIFLDRQKNVWITSQFGGIKIINPQKHKLKFLDKRSGLTSDSALGMLQDEQNRIWITEAHNLDMIDITTKTITRYDLGSALYSSLISDGNGNIWITAFSNIHSPPDLIKIVSPEKKLVKLITSGRLSSNEVRPLLRDDRGQIWIPTRDGLNIINKKNGAVMNHEGSVEINDLKEAIGKILIGTVHDGVWILDTATRRVRILNSKNGLSGDTINSMYEQDGKMWILTNKGVDIVDWQGRSIEHFGRVEGMYGDATLITGEELGEGRNRVWLITSDKSRLRAEVLDLKKRTVEHLSIDHDLSDVSPSSMAHDRQGNIWVAYHTGGVKMIDPLNRTISNLKDYAGTNEHYNKVLLGDHAGNLWIGTDQGILIINAAKDSLTKISTNEGLISDQIISLDQSQDQIYAGTWDGITVITPPSPQKKNWKFQSFGRQDGIVKTTGTTSNLVTKQGKFMYGDKGITTLAIDSTANLPGETFITSVDLFNSSQSFSNGPWSSLNKKDTLWRNDNRRFFAAGDLPPGFLSPNNGETQFDSVSGFYNMPVNLSLPYYQNYLQFHFTQIHGNSNDTTWYRYVLEGVSKKWSERTYVPISENYLNLDPGRYKFEVSSLYRGKWTKPAEFSFTIRPPWWKTWWAYCLFVLAFFAILYVAVQYRSRKLKAANLDLEEKINKRTSELTQSLQELKSTQTQLVQSEKMASLGELTAGIAHEIQNPLNFVNNFSEINGEMIAEMKQEIDKGNYDEVKLLANNIEENGKKITHHGRRAEAIVKSMLQHSRTGSGKTEPTDINALADEYLRLAYHGLRAKDKSFNAKIHADLDKGIGHLNVVAQDIGRVLLNLINNAFYAVAEKKQQLDGSYEPTVSISTRQINYPLAEGGNKIQIKVKDNGNGIPEKIANKIFQPFFTTKPTGQGTGLGLSLSHDIIKAHGGEIKVETKEGEGSEFTIYLPSKEK